MADIIDVNIADQTLEVYWQDEVELNLDMSLMYIKSGEAEIQKYVDEVTKPHIDNYIVTEAEPIVAKVVERIAEPKVNEYLTNTTLPSIDTYIESKKPELHEYVNQATEFATSAQASATASASSSASAAASAEAAGTSEDNAAQSATNAQNSAQSAASTVNGFDTHVAEKTSEYDTHAAQKTSEFDANAADKQADVDASAAAAAQSATAAETARDEAIAAGRKATIGNIGDIQFTIRNDIPNGSVWCDGTEYSKAEFPDVYAMLVSGSLYNTTYEIFNDLVSNNGSCGFFALDATNEKFKVPSLNNIALEAGQLPVGFMAESLPQHTHTYQHYNGGEAGYIGNGGAAKNALGNFTSGEANNPTYQDGAKVKTDRAVYRAYVVMYTGETEVSDAVVSEILGACARRDLGNVPANYDFIVDSGSSTEGNQTAFYALFKSGLLIQWGQLETIAGDNTVTLPKPFADTSYQVFHGVSNKDFGTVSVGTKTVTALNKTTSNWLLKEASVYEHDWMAIGQGAV